MDKMKNILMTDDNEILIEQEIDLGGERYELMTNEEFFDTEEFSIEGDIVVEYSNGIRYENGKMV